MEGMPGAALIRFIRGLLYVIVIATPLFYLRKGVYPYILSKAAFFQGLVEILFFAWVALLVVEPRYRPKKTVLGIAILVFLVAFGITSITGVDAARSFWSTQERATGLFFFLHIYALVFVIASIFPALNWRRLLAASLGTAALVSVLALFQLVNPNLLLQESVGDRPGATFGNPTFLAGYLVLNIMLGIYLLYDRFRSIERTGRGTQAFLVMEILIAAVALMNAQTRGDILGLAAGIGALTGLFIFAPPEGAMAWKKKGVCHIRHRHLCARSGILAYSHGFFLARSTGTQPIPRNFSFRQRSSAALHYHANRMERFSRATGIWMGMGEFQRGIQQTVRS